MHARSVECSLFYSNKDVHQVAFLGCVSVPLQVKFFQQGTMPCVTESGRIIMVGALGCVRAHTYLKVKKIQMTPDCLPHTDLQPLLENNNFSDDETRLHGFYAMRCILCVNLIVGSTKHILESDVLHVTYPVSCFVLCTWFIFYT